MANALPDSQHRFRCGRCGNLTRFDVVKTSTVKQYWHSDMSGDVSIDETVTTAEEVQSVSCRWCGATEEIELVLRPAAGGPDSEPEAIN